MELIKLLPKPKHPSIKRTYVRKDVNQEQWLQDLHRHCKQYKRCCATANNRDLKRIEDNTNRLLSQAQ
jgi:hypothetical protein